jgi:hypothetical protein
MFDTVNLLMTFDKAGGMPFTEIVPQFLSAVNSTGVNKFGFPFVSGTLDNYRVNLTDTRLYLHDGSLCKYYLGDNFGTLSRGDAGKAIQKLSDTLHLEMKNSTVTRLDFAQNLIMRYPESVYYPYLGESRYYRRLEQDNGLYYKTNNRLLLFYGKTREQGSKGAPIPELYQKRNLLRYEIRFIRALRRQLNREQIPASLLNNENFYRLLVDRWKAEYFKISKVKYILNDMKPTGSRKELSAQAMRIIISQVGSNQFISELKQWQDRGEISKKQAFDLRSFIKELSQDPTGAEPNELISELDSKVKEITRFC